RFRERKAQLITGVEESSLTNSLKSRMRSPLYDELHQLLVELFDEMNATERTNFNSVFRADILLTALRSDSYLFQKDVRNYSPEMILEQLCALFILHK
ncbi:MAG: TetR/AcrR family transcriptional regulator, partial [Peptococcaceae bacterium]|nr:TetR/AcrR family transcriptional regulator [Peptococcaceae bacterium]